MRLLKALNILFIAAVYFGLAVVSLEFSFHSSNASPVWPPSGFAFAILLLRNQKLAFGIFIGAFSANLFVFLRNGTCALQTAVWVSMFIAAGNTMEALAGYFLLKRLSPNARVDQLFKHVHSVYKFVLTALIMCTASCTIGSISILIAGIIPSYQFLLVWFTWWAGDASGILLLTPFIIVMAGTFKKNTEVYPAKLMETTIVVAAATIISGIVFRNWFYPNYVFSRSFIITPFLIWAAIRVHQRIVMTLLLFSAFVALTGTLMGTGPFANASLNESLLTVEVFVSINSVMVLLLQAAIMERRKHELYLNATRENLENLVSERTRELRSKNEQLEKRNNELAMFSYSASHDLREPLRKIEFFSNKLLESAHPFSEQEERLVKRIRTTTQRMNQLVENLLSYSSLGVQETILKPTDLNFVLTEVQHILAKEIEHTGAIIDAMELPVVQGVRSQLLQLFANILGNSLKFRRSELPPRITIESEVTNEFLCEGVMRTEGPYFHLTVRDNGIGFEKEYAGKVFDILQKLHGQSEYEGTGIGLAICKKVVENHNGFISADAEPGNGTVIHIHLPRGSGNENSIINENVSESSK